MTITYDKDGAYIEIVENGVTYRRSIRWEDCVVSVPEVGTEKIDMVYVNGSDQLVLVLEDESEITVISEGGLAIYLLADGSRELTGNLAVTALKTIDGRDISVDGAKLDGIATGADVTGSNAPQAHKDSHDPEDGSDLLDTAVAAEISVVVAAGEGTSHSLARADHVHAINHAIVDNHILTVDGIINNGEYLKATANGGEGRTYAEVLSDISAGKISAANRTIYVDKEATGAADGTSWANAFTTIQAAMNDLEDTVIHAHTILVRDGTKKTGTADENTANHLVDDGNAQFVAGDVGKRVFNVDDGTWGVIGSFVDAGDVGIVDSAGANLDLFPDGDEDYVIEPTPYRETVYLNSLPATNPAKNILGSLTIKGEFYFSAICDANAVAGNIVDASYDFSDIEIGDRVWVLDRNGANNRAQDYEYGTVNDVTNAATGTLGTTLTKTPTTLWNYGIVKTEVSGSDDALAAGEVRDFCFYGTGINKVNIYGFYMTWADSRAVRFNQSQDIKPWYNIIEDCDVGIQANNNTAMIASYNYVDVDEYCLWVDFESVVTAEYSIWYARTGNERGLYVHRHSFVKTQYTLLDTAAGGADGEAMSAYLNSAIEAVRCHITNGFLIGLFARYNASIFPYQCNNNAGNAEDPGGTTEGAYIA